MVKKKKYEHKFTFSQIQIQIRLEIGIEILGWHGSGDNARKANYRLTKRLNNMKISYQKKVTKKHNYQLLIENDTSTLYLKTHIFALA